MRGEESPGLKRGDTWVSMSESIEKIRPRGSISLQEGSSVQQKSQLHGQALWQRWCSGRDKGANKVYRKQSNGMWAAEMAAGCTSSGVRQQSKEGCMETALCVEAEDQRELGLSAYTGGASRQ